MCVCNTDKTTSGKMIIDNLFSIRPYCLIAINTIWLDQRKLNAYRKFRKLPVHTAHTWRLVVNASCLQFPSSEWHHSTRRPNGEAPSGPRTQGPSVKLTSTSFRLGLDVHAQLVALQARHPLCVTLRRRSPGRMLLSEHCGGHKVRVSPVTPALPHTSRAARRPHRYWTQSHIVDLDELRWIPKGSASQPLESQDPQLFHSAQI